MPPFPTLVGCETYREEGERNAEKQSTDFLVDWCSQNSEGDRNRPTQRSDLPSARHAPAVAHGRCCRHQPDLVGGVVQRAELIVLAPRPQFDSVLKYPSTSSCVGIGRTAVIPASTPPGHAVRGTAGRVSRPLL